MIPPKELQTTTEEIKYNSEEQDQGNKINKTPEKLEDKCPNFLPWEMVIKRCKE